MSIYDKFRGVADKYNTPNPQSGITLKSPAQGMEVTIPIVTEFVDEVPGEYVTDVLGNVKPGSLYTDNSGNLIVGVEDGGPTFGPSSKPVILGGPESLRTATKRPSIDDLFNTISTTTGYTTSVRTHDLPNYLDTKDLMFIKDKIEEGYSYIKIKNLDELKQAFKRLGCYISASDISTIATVGVFKLNCGQYAIIN